MDSGHQGRRVLVWHSGISDPLAGWHYTLKVCASEKAVSGDDTWRYVRVTLKPLKPGCEEIALTRSDEDDVRVMWGVYVGAARVERTMTPVPPVATA